MAGGGGGGGVGTLDIATGKRHYMSIFVDFFYALF
jgi:hypothetical protein